MKRVLDYLSKVKSLCSVIGLDYKETICNIHPTLEDSVATVDISNRTIEKLATKIEDLQDMKKKRVQKVYTCISAVPIFNFVATYILCQTSSSLFMLM